MCITNVLFFESFFYNRRRPISVLMKDGEDSGYWTFQNLRLSALLFELLIYGCSIFSLQNVFNNGHTLSIMYIENIGSAEKKRSFLSSK